MNKIIIAPSILTASFANLESTIKELEEAGADYLHTMFVAFEQMKERLLREGLFAGEHKKPLLSAT